MGGIALVCVIALAIAGKYTPESALRIAKLLIPYLELVRYLGIPLRPGLADGPIAADICYAMTGIGVWFSCLAGTVNLLAFIKSYHFLSDLTFNARHAEERLGYSLYSRAGLVARFSVLFFIVASYGFFWLGFSGAVTFHPGDIGALVVLVTTSFMGYSLPVFVAGQISLLAFDAVQLKKLLIRWRAKDQ
ncbi:hypothetical protein [Sulfuriferula nivalis]|uniref:Uncharacterized protein n=1 Tax=Sulfuriferula nivalis TaxID=2675298 RepID=A0A809S8H9_9PROT|nr:hypothetical protein [Sulfuriferula nivalis]BBP00543.1 hypothetical protein SFSGTM_12510 [Sulfuriferula nivalis]